MTAQPGYQTVLNTYCTISGVIKAINQTIKFVKLIECDIRKIFLEKSCTKCGGETSPRPFSGKLKLRISLDQ